MVCSKDSTNPKWYKIAYIPPNAKDASEAIYGVIHSSQVGFECEQDFNKTLKSYNLNPKARELNLDKIHTNLKNI